MLQRLLLRVNNIKMFVLNEADEMLSLGLKDMVFPPLNCSHYAL